jgi:hypothetical protein
VNAVMKLQILKNAEKLTNGCTTGGPSSNDQVRVTLGVIIIILYYFSSIFFDIESWP